jgi:hypothetical protein
MSDLLKALDTLGYFRGLIVSSSVNDEAHAGVPHYEEWNAATGYNTTTLVDIPDDLNLWDRENLKFNSRSPNNNTIRSSTYVRPGNDYVIRYIQESAFGASTGEDPRVEDVGDPWSHDTSEGWQGYASVSEVGNGDDTPMRWRPFDGTNSQCESASPVSWVLDFDTQIDTLILMGLENVATVRVQYDSYDETQTLRSSDFPGVQIDRCVFDDLPNAPTANCTVTLTAPSGGNCKISRFLWGKSLTLGQTGVDSDLSVASYPTLTDGAITGNTAFRGAQWTVGVERDHLRFVQAFMEAHLNAPLAIWGNPNSELNGLRYGLIREFRPPLTPASLLTCDLTIQDIDNLL